MAQMKSTVVPSNDLRAMNLHVYVVPFMCFLALHYNSPPPQFDLAYPAEDKREEETSTTSAPSGSVSPSTATSSNPIKCSHGFTLCSDNSECIRNNYFCDGETDCRDGSDEARCSSSCERGNLCISSNFLNMVLLPSSEQCWCTGSKFFGFILLTSQSSRTRCRPR